MTSILSGMTMLSFRVEATDARSAQFWADRLGIDKSALLREALRQHLLRLASERDAEAWARQPLTEDEGALMAADTWAPAEEWADWADAAR